MGAIVLQFVQGKGFGASLIQWFDHGLYSHVDSVLPDGTLLGARNDVIGGVPAGVQIRPATYVAGETVLRITVPCTVNQEEAYYSFVKSQIGCPYDQMAIAAFIPGRLWRTSGAWFCSELCAAALEESKVVLPLKAPVNKIAPDDLLLVLSAFVSVA